MRSRDLDGRLNSHRAVDSGRISHYQSQTGSLEDHMELSPVAYFAASHFPIPHETHTDIDLCMTCDRKSRIWTPDFGPRVSICWMSPGGHYLNVYSKWHGPCHLVSSHIVWSSRAAGKALLRLRYRSLLTIPRGHDLDLVDITSTCLQQDKPVILLRTPYTSPVDSRKVWNDDKWFRVSEIRIPQTKCMTRTCST